MIPEWNSDNCIQCERCSYVCPHGVIRPFALTEEEVKAAPEGAKTIPLIGVQGYSFAIGISAYDCTGCGSCANVCPGKKGAKALTMVNAEANSEDTQKYFDSYVKAPIKKDVVAKFGENSVKGSQFKQPLLEFSGACAGCGETPYVKLLSQLFGDRLLVANATGCSSIYGGNQPTTPWSVNSEGRGPAWSNSLFEDNAEFGLGFRLTADKHLAYARELLQALGSQLDRELLNDLLEAEQTTEIEIRRQRGRVAELKQRLKEINDPRAVQLLAIVDQLVRRSIWIVGGDGWAYDIGSSGVDHVLASGRDVNILVMDTEVYSNTGGQMSKSTPLGAVAKFAAAGKVAGKKDMALQAISYGNVYVARVALGANPQQTLLAFREAEAYPGPSLILAYSHCIAHGINMQRGLDQQHLAVESGHWPLVRYNPAVRESGANPFVLDSARPKIPLKQYRYNEVRYKVLAYTNPKEAEQLMELAQHAVNRRWSVYEEMAARSGADFQPIFKQ